jgi:hypothetical protein
MPRTFALSAQYPVSVEDVYATFADQRYWLARLADSGADAAVLDAMTVDAGRGISIATTLCISRCRLPALAAQFHPGDLEVVRSEQWSAIRDRTAHARVIGKVLRAPARLSGDAVLESTATGCTLHFTATVQVDIPLVGGKVESFIGAQLAGLMTAEQRFTSQWVAQEDQRSR